MSPLASPRPRFSIVSAVYNVEPYLPDFIASIEAQRFDLGRVEVIAVDDGSTDGSRGILEDWARRRPGLVTVLSQPNGGQASARNLGLEHATGEWVTFTDPDDMLDRDFLAVADRFAAAHPDVEVLGAKPVVLDEATGQVTDSHPRRRQYAAGNRVVDLERRPSTFLGVSAGSLFRLDRIRASELRYDPRIRPNFEDGHFAGRYVLGLDVPRIGLLRDAKYLYRRRTSKDSTLQTSYSHPGRYSDVLRYGYLDLLQSARDRHGFVPAWVQHLVIYELSWYLSEDEKVATSIRIADDVVPQFHGLLADVVAFLDPAVVLSPTARRLKPTWAAILAYGLRPDAWRSPVAVRTKVDRVTGLQRVCYRYTGAAPPEEFRLDGAPVAPVHGKVMAHVYYRRTLLHERLAWLPADGTLEVRLGGEPIPIVADWLLPVRPVSPAAPNEVPAAASGRGRPRVGPRAALRPLRRAAGRAAARLAVLPTQVAAWLAGVPARLGTWRDRTLAGAWPHRSRYRSAWVLMDRTHEAGDNGERLFEHIRAERPDVNAWFVVEKGTADWERLHASRPDRVVAHGSFRWKMLMLNSSWLLSSHADQVVAEPPAILRIVGKPTWKYGFLQHGVIKDDLSLWLNDRDIDLFVVSTQAELASIAADGTTYRFTTLETQRHRAAPLRPAAGQGARRPRRRAGPRHRGPDVADVPHATERVHLAAEDHRCRTPPVRVLPQLGPRPAIAGDRAGRRPARPACRLHAAPEDAGAARTGGPPAARRGADVRGHRRPGSLCPMCTARHRLLVGRLQHRAHRWQRRLLPVRPGPGDERLRTWAVRGTSTTNETGSGR